MRRLATLCLVLVSIAAINPVWSTEPKAAEEPVIPGITIERKDSKALLGIQILDDSFKLSFYDEEKMPVKADFSRALLRWDVTYKNV